MANFSRVSLVNQPVNGTNPSKTTWKFVNNAFSTPIEEILSNSELLSNSFNRIISGSTARVAVQQSPVEKLKSINNQAAGCKPVWIPGEVFEVVCIPSVVTFIASNLPQSIEVYTASCIKALRKFTETYTTNPPSLNVPPNCRKYHYN